jgi:hypothetical protein
MGINDSGVSGRYLCEPVVNERLAEGVAEGF